jgi:hypothetical protein
MINTGDRSKITIIAPDPKQYVKKYRLCVDIEFRLPGKGDPYPEESENILSTVTISHEINARHEMK